MSAPGPCRLNPSTPTGYAELLLRGRIDRARSRSRSRSMSRLTSPESSRPLRDAGASAIEWVIISALLVAIAVAVGGVLMTKLRTKADSINLNTTVP